MSSDDRGGTPDRATRPPGLLAPGAPLRATASRASGASGHSAAMRSMPGGAALTGAVTVDAAQAIVDAAWPGLGGVDQASSIGCCSSATEPDRGSVPDPIRHRAASRPFGGRCRLQPWLIFGELLAVAERPPCEQARRDLGGVLRPASSKCRIQLHLR